MCPNDGDELVPPSVARVQSVDPATAVQGKICPTCGGRFEATVAAFCGTDGTQLVLLKLVPRHSEIDGLPVEVL